MPGIVLHVPSDLEAGGYGPQSPRNSVGLRHYCRFSLAILPVLGRHVFMERMLLVGHEEAMELRVANAILKRLPQEAAVLNDVRFSAEEFISARRSVLIENERKAQKAAWIGVVDVHEDYRIDLHPSLAGGMQESFQ